MALVLSHLLTLLVLAHQLQQLAGEPVPSDGYMRARRHLLHLNEAYSFDANMPMSTAETALNHRLQEWKASAVQHIRGKGFEPTATPFAKIKHLVRETKLFAIIDRIPKGGLLHTHESSMGRLDWVIDVGIYHDNVYLKWSSNAELAADNGMTAIYFDIEQVPANFYSARYLNATVANFHQRLRRLYCISDVDKSTNADEAWNRFQGIFTKQYALMHYMPVFKMYMEDALLTLHRNRVQHVEIRFGIYPYTDLGRNQVPAFEAVDVVDLIAHSIRRRLGLSQADFSISVIMTTSRGGSLEDVQQALEMSFRMRAQRPNLVSGFDLVAQEDIGHSTKHFAAVWERLPQLSQHFNVSMPLYLHDGESDSIRDTNLVDALMLKCPRIGHAFNIIMFPYLEQLARQNRVCLEICPLSNQMLRLVDDLRLHPAAHLLRNGAFISVANDDPGMFDTEAMSYDYWMASVAWDIDLRGLKQLVNNSIEFSSLRGERKKQATATLNAAWASFVHDWTTTMTEQSTSYGIAVQTM